ncbi:aldehyde dehydrogenase family 3 member F1-like isoform X1 [Punica granatum]|uniref:Aldehyde dehydrogenase n=2 Tax=Punica granatum TaxID=22663 RepID=A0A218WKY9_PUNGR|nr:aldehyde dehydrogenase family 3 member F1-like isoform X1 [Punica granatum]OWM73494.1 hypothetical protein CDL15_Pgr026593 [Punica granatum]PKI60195.1 hypothetical protein CRG98_019383 [Punica granatum]
MEAIDDLDLQLGMLREYYYSGKTRDASWRRSQLKGILSLLKEREDELFRALHQDLGKHPVEAYRDEIGCLIKSVNYALDCLSQWMSGRKAKLPRAALLTSAEIIPEPLGLVLIISSWNFPFGLSLEPLIGALAAGNVAVLKPSESAPASSSLLANLIPVYLDNKAVNVVEGGPDVGQQLLHKKWDKIFFTGSTKIGRAVMAAASENLTPVTLELGGKCPAVIDSLTRSLDREVAVQRVLGTKFSPCAGQACIAIDYVLVEEKFSPTLVELMKGMMKKMFGENPKESGSIARIVNKRHLQRLKSLLDDPLVKASIVHGGSMDEDSLYIEPTILLDPPTKAAIMVDEIFGPLLPIITLNKIEDSINFINSRPKPLAIYGFTNNESLKTRMISQTSSGSLTFNDAVIQYAADTLPFGGIGESGMGKYHGKFSFDTFSHQKAVLRRSFLIDFWFRFPPWNDYKLQLFRAMYGFNYLLLLLITLGLKRSK